MTKWRAGRKQPHNVYLQLGEEPSDADVCIGHFHDADRARLAIDSVNAAIAQAG